MNSARNVSEALAWGATRIEGTEAALLLSQVLGRGQAWLYAHGDDPVERMDLQRYGELVERRRLGEPVAYLVGRRGFWTLDLAVGPDTLIPRPETELLVEQALARLDPRRELRVADLGTGSGAIALAIASERPRARIVATDRSEGALAVARANAEEHGLLARVEFRAGDWFAPLAGERFDLVASNPPYIAEGDPHLEQGDLRHEPAAALASGPDGLDAIRRIVGDAPGYLRPGGWLMLEHGHDQGPAVAALLGAAGFAEVGTVADLEGRDRVGLGRWPGGSETGAPEAGW